MPKPRRYEIDVLLHLAAFLETSTEQSAAAIVESGLHGLGVPWCARSILDRAPARTERRGLRLALEKLEARGAVRLVGAGATGRLTHVRPRLVGLIEAVRRAKGRADVAAICSTLERTRWGIRLGPALRKACEILNADKPPAKPSSPSSLKRNLSDDPPMDPPEPPNPA